MGECIRIAKDCWFPNVYLVDIKMDQNQLVLFSRWVVGLHQNVKKILKDGFTAYHAYHGLFIYDVN